MTGKANELSEQLMGFKWDNPRLTVADTIGETPGQEYLHCTARVLLARHKLEEASRISGDLHLAEFKVSPPAFSPRAV